MCPLVKPPSNPPTFTSGFESGITPDNVSRGALVVLESLQQAGHEAYLVGGGVRDVLIGFHPKDFDVATTALPQQVRTLFRRSRLIGRRFVLVHVRIGREVIEVATFRSTPTDEEENSSNINADGRIVRDNEYGTLVEDAERRDFTINSIYYDPSTDTIIDFSDGLKDLKNKTLRIIGNPNVRYQEDPVRMLRAVRFAAKLGFSIDQKTAAPIGQYSCKLQGIPSSRLYEEVLKLLMTGIGERTYQLLLDYGLFARLFPETDAAIAAEPAGLADRLTRCVLADTDSRIAHNKPTTPAFLFAALLWEPVLHDARAHIARGLSWIQAYDTAGADLIERQSEVVLLPRRLTLIAREIWLMQPELENERGSKAEQLLARTRFRAAYDFLLLRAGAGEPVQECADWWTHYQKADSHERNLMHEKKLMPEKKSRKPRRRRRRCSSAATNQS